MEKQNYKRKDYLEWEEYFMSIAFLSAQRSKDPRTQVGACIVNKEKKIVGIGYNGMPIGCDDDLMPWNRSEDKSQEQWLNSKSPYVCHAEMNAVLNKNQADIKNCTIYVALFPCNRCAQIVIQSGIKEVVYYSDKYHDVPEFKASRHLLDMAKIKYRQFRPSQKQILIDFAKIEDTSNDTLSSLNCKDQCTNVTNNGDASAVRRNGFTTMNINNNNLSIDSCRRESSFLQTKFPSNISHFFNSSSSIYTDTVDCDLYAFALVFVPIAILLLLLILWE